MIINNSGWKALFILATALSALITNNSARAVVLVGYDFNGGSGDATTTGTGIVTLPFTGSAGINSPTFTSGYIRATGWENAETGADYYTFSILNSNAAPVDLTTLTFSERQQNGNSPANWRIGVSLGSGFFEPDLGGGSGNGATSAAFTQHVVDLSGLQVAASGSLDVRIYGFNAANANQGWRIDNVSLEGNISAVPEPHEYAMIASLLLIGFAGFRRWKLAHKSA